MWDDSAKPVPAESGAAENAATSSGVSLRSTDIFAERPVFALLLGPILLLALALLLAWALIDVANGSALLLAVALLAGDAFWVSADLRRGRGPALGRPWGVAAPLIPMILVMAAVTGPLFLAAGPTSDRLKPFAATLVGAALLSGLVALALVLSFRQPAHPTVHHPTRLHAWYRRRLTRVRNQGPLAIAIMLGALAGAGWLFAKAPLELLPDENGPPLNRSGSSLPMQFTIGAVGPSRELDEVIARLLQAARQSDLLAHAEVEHEAQALALRVDREKAAALGLPLDEIGRGLARLFGSGEVERIAFDENGRALIPHPAPADRSPTERLTRYYITGPDANLVPFVAVVSVEPEAPDRGDRSQPAYAATIRGMPLPGVTVDEAVDYLWRQAGPHLPAGLAVAYAGESRRVVAARQEMFRLLLLGLALVSGVLAAWFRSLRMALTALAGVPVALLAALASLHLGAAAMNGYALFGLLSLVGLVGRHGVLIVDRAERLRRKQGGEFHAVAAEAAATRLGPILITTIAVVTAAVALLVTGGAPGLGLVIGAGMPLGTLSALILVPACYAPRLS